MGFKNRENNILFARSRQIFKIHRIRESDKIGWGFVFKLSQIMKLIALLKVTLANDVILGKGSSLIRVLSAMTGLLFR